MLQGKVAIVTGSSRGIGKKIVEIFTEQNAIVIANSRREGSMDNWAKDLSNKQNAKIYPVYFDVSNHESVKNGFRRIFEITKKIDILVNNAGILQDSLLGMVTQKQVEESFSTNTYGMIYCTQYSSRLMTRNKSGSIINISSIIGTNGNEGQTVYAGTKAAIIGVTKSLAKELAPLNIRVNAVAPGFIDTDMSRSIPEVKFIERVSSIKMNRIGTPEDVANVVLFLASDLSSYVTGQVIGVDGGMLI